MDCPVCKTVQLSMSDRQGIEIDYCPQCRGVWLDRGELDKLIERSADWNPGAAQGGARASAPPPQPAPPAAQAPQNPYQQPYQNPWPQQHHGKPYRKRKGLLSELFDFD